MHSQHDRSNCVALVMHRLQHKITPKRFFLGDHRGRGRLCERPLLAFTVFLLHMVISHDFDVGFCHAVSLLQVQLHDAMDLVEILKFVMQNLDMEN